jgi:glutathione S-transferase
MVKSLLEGFFTKTTTALTSQPPKNRPKVSVPSDFVAPEPRPLAITRPETIPDILKSSLALALRLATGVFVLGWKIDSVFLKPDESALDTSYALALGPLRIRDTSSVLSLAPRPSPTKSIILYEYESSPFCRRVREIVNLLDLTVEYRPCPGARQGSFSNELFQRTGRRTVPYLYDENTGTGLFESNDIIEYLLDTYGPPSSSYDRKALWPITWEAFALTTSTYAAMIRGFPASRRQANAREDNEQMIPLELWGYESSPFVRPVREKLCALSLPHKMISCSRGSQNRDRLVQLTGRTFQVPYLVDPNTGVSLYESYDIVDYLDKVYTVSI